MVKINTKKFFSQYDDFYKVIKGSEFKKANPTYQPYKMINNNNYKFVIGKNNIKNPYDCSFVNTRFFDITEIAKYIDPNNNDQIAKIELIDDADVTIEMSECVEFDFDYIYKKHLICSTNEFIITNIISKYDYINSLTNKKICKLIKYNPHVLKYVNNKTNHMMKLANVNDHMSLFK